MRRVDGQGRQHGKDLLQEIVAEPVDILRAQVLRGDHRDAGLGEFNLQAPPHGLLLVDETRALPGDFEQLLGGRAPIEALLGHAVGHLSLEARQAHHEELIEVARRYREEAQPFQHGMAEIARLGEHAPVEGEPGEFAIQVAAARIEARLCGDGGGFIFGKARHALRPLWMPCGTYRFTATRTRTDCSEQPERPGDAASKTGAF